MELLIETFVRRKWWRKHYRPELKYLANPDPDLPWHTTLKEIFEAEKPEGVHCSIYACTNGVVNQNSRKANSSKGPFYGVFDCRGKECKRRYEFRIEDFDSLTEKQIPMKVYGMYVGVLW